MALVKAPQMGLVGGSAISHEKRRNMHSYYSLCGLPSLERNKKRGSFIASAMEDSSGSLPHWQSSFATLSGQVAHQMEKEGRQREDGDSMDLAPLIERVVEEEEQVEEEKRKENDHDKEEEVHGGPNNGFAIQLKEPESGTLQLNLPRAVSISDLSPAPLHGSILRVAYQGVPGAYSEAAACKAYPECDPVPCDQFEVAFSAVELWVADRAVMPVENSLGGSIHRNYDLLLRHRLHIVGEVQLPVHHCLLALPGVTLRDLRRVISHPQALSQCEGSLTELGLREGVAREAVDDTAGAAQFIAHHGLRDTAAIASARAAEIYGMNILAEGIQDDSHNVTRFVMLAREPIIPRTDRPFKTSIVFANEEATGSLFKVLSAFSLRDINLTKIESRPQRNRPLRVVDSTNRGTAKYFEYLFYVDFEASMAEPRAQKAVAELQEFTTFLRVLGSYPMDMTPLIHS